MNTATKRFSVSLPPKLFKELEAARRDQQSTRSEFIRTILRAWNVESLPPVELSSDDINAIETGRKEIARGEYVTLDQVK